MRRGAATSSPMQMTMTEQIDLHTEAIDQCRLPLPKAMKSSLVEPAVDHAINCGIFTPMRVGGPLLFVAPLVLVIQRQRVVGAVILSSILVTTFITHRPRKAWSQGLR